MLLILENSLRKMGSRNFGLRSRDTHSALRHAYQLTSHSYASAGTVKTALRQFNEHLRENGIKDLRKVTKGHVKSYADKLFQRFENDELSISSLQNYLSAVNVAMNNARLDKRCHVDPVKEAGFPKRSGVATANKTLSREEFRQICRSVSPKTQVQLQLQREFGLRCKESALIDAKKCYREALKTNVVTISLGTKGGRARKVEIVSERQIEALKQASELQGNNKSLIPHDKSWAQHQNDLYRELAGRISPHTNRHNYAYDLYFQKSGVLCPVQAQINHKKHHEYMANELNISVEDAKALDHQVRLEVAESLGHSRTDITNAYLG